MIVPPACNDIQINIINYMSYVSMTRRQLL